jgi:hypothetical protein
VSVILTPEQGRLLVKLGLQLDGIDDRPYQAMTKKWQAAIPAKPTVKKTKDSPAKQMKGFVDKARQSP